MADKPTGQPQAAAGAPVEKRDNYDSSGGWPIPVFDVGDTFRDIGSSGLRQFSGWVREEFLQQLQGRQAARTYREMLDNSSIVNALMFALTQSMRKIEWRTQGPSDTPAAKEMEDFADSLRFDMSHTWEDFMTEAFSMLGYGYAPHEINYKRRMGPQPYDPIGEANGNYVPSSAYNDGRIGLRSLPLRGQDTVLKWFFGANGQVLGLTQQPWIGPIVDIPMEKMLLFRPSMHKGNPEGRSVLRGSYRSWYFIKRMEEQEAILFERMSGFPVMYLPTALLEKATAKNPDPAALAAYNAYKKLVTNVRIDEQMGALIPSDPYPGPNGPSNVRMYEFALVTPQFGRSAGTGSNTIIERHKLDVLMTCLADFIEMGHSSRGAQNLAVSKVDMFFQAIEGWVNGVAAVLNRHLMPKIWRLNALPDELMPEYIPDLAQRIDLDVLGNFIYNLAQAGMTLFPDVDLENYIRDAAGLPDISDETAYATATANPDALKKMLMAAFAKAVKRRQGATRLRGKDVRVRGRKK